MSLRRSGPSLALMVFALFLISRQARAITLGSETGAGSTTFIQSLTADGDLGGGGDQDALTPWDWGVGYSYTRTDTAAQPNQPSILDETTELNATLGWSGEKSFGLDGEVVWSYTPEEYVVSSGANLGASYTFRYGGGGGESKATSPSPKEAVEAGADHDDVESSGDDFGPSLKARLGVGRRNYTQRFTQTTTLRRKTTTVVRPVNGTNAIEQSSVGPSLKWRPFASWHFDASYMAFFYNRDVASFETLLDSRRATQVGFSSLSNTVGGLPLASESVGFGVDLLTSLSFDASETYSIMAADLSTSSVTSGKFSVQFSDAFRVSLGAEYSSSSTSYETMGIIGLEGTF